MGHMMKNPKQRRMLIAGGAIAAAVLLFILLRKKSTATTEEPTAVAAAAPAAASGEAAGGGGSTGGGSGEVEQLGNTIGAALQTQSAEQDQVLQGLSAQVSALQSGYERNQQAAQAATTPPPAENTGPTGTPLASSNRANAAKKYTNTEPGNPRKGQTYTIQPAKGGVLHIYSNGERIFVPTSRSPSQPPSPSGGGGSGGGGGGPQVVSQSPQPQNPFPNVNPTTGEHYRVEQGHGGVWHIYHNGHKVFVRS